VIIGLVVKRLRWFDHYGVGSFNPLSSAIYRSWWPEMRLVT